MNDRARAFLDTHPGAPYAAAVLIVFLWCVGAVLAGEPALDAPDVLPPAVYVVAPDVVEVTVVPPTAPSPEARAAAGLPPAAAAGSVTSTTPFVDESAAAPIRGDARQHGCGLVGITDIGGRTMIIHTRTTWREFHRASRLGKVPTRRQIRRYLAGRTPEGDELAYAAACVRAVLDRPTQLGPDDTLAADLLALVEYAVEQRNARERASRMLHPSNRATLGRLALANPETNPGMCRDLAQCAQTCHRLEQTEAALRDRSTT